jgi:glycosyl transferase family 1
MSLKILCSGNMVRFPLGGFVWHHFQYLAGLRDLGHEVTYFEDYGWRNSCYDPSRDLMTADPTYGIAHMLDLWRRYGLEARWCYLAEDGTAHGMSREELAESCRECDVYLNLSNLNWIPELALCRRRVLVDTDPVFTQIGGLGMGGPFSDYAVLFTYGENVHQPGSTMPAGGARWLPTRQPVVLEVWPVEKADPAAPFTTVTSWDSVGDHWHEGRVFGGKAREFEPFFTLPRDTGETMEIAVGIEPKICDPKVVRERLAGGGWRVLDALEATRTPWRYQQYLRASRAEFSVAKQGYVTTQCGWFSERSAAYLASGRPVVVQDTGFSRFLPCGEGLLAYRDREEAIAAIRRLRDDYDGHCRAARAFVEEFFNSRRVLADLLERSI